MSGWGSRRTLLTAEGEGVLQQVAPSEACIHSRETGLRELGSCCCKSGLSMSAPPHTAARGRRGEVSLLHSWPRAISSPHMVVSAMTAGQGLASQAAAGLQTSNMSELGRGEASVLLSPPSREATDAADCTALACDVILFLIL